jgi:hypothetical protein
MSIYALSFNPVIPWQAIIILCALFAVLPFLVRKYRLQKWDIPKLHYVVFLTLCIIIYYYYHLFKLRLHHMDRITYLWDNNMMGPMIVDPEVDLPIPYRSEVEVFLEFLIVTLPPIIFTLIIAMMVFWGLKFRKSRRKKSHV